MAILRMDVRILVALLDIGADRSAPCLQVWQGAVMRTPKEMCANLPPPYNTQMAGILEMTVKQRAVVLANINGTTGAVRRGEISSKIHVNHGVKVKEKAEEEA